MKIQVPITIKPTEEQLKEIYNNSSEKNTPIYDPTILLDDVTDHLTDQLEEYKRKLTKIMTKID